MPQESDPQQDQGPRKLKALYLHGEEEPETLLRDKDMEAMKGFYGRAIGVEHGDVYSVGPSVGPPDGKTFREKVLGRRQFNRPIDVLQVEIGVTDRLKEWSRDFLDREIKAEMVYLGIEEEWLREYACFKTILQAYLRTEIERDHAKELVEVSKRFLGLVERQPTYHERIKERERSVEAMRASAAAVRESLRPNPESTPGS